MSLRRTFILLAALAGAASTQGAEPLLGTPTVPEFVSSQPFYHPSVAADSKGQPHFVCDPGGNTQFAKFHRVNGAWKGGVFAVGAHGGRYDASRLYIGQIEIDGKDRAWVSCKFGCKDFGSMLGYGVWLFGNVANDSTPSELFFKFLNAKGHGCISTDAKYPDMGVGMATGGLYDKLNAAGNEIGSGTINAGPGGEKMRFRIASYAPRYPEGSTASYPDGIWHTAMNGYSGFASAYQNSARYKAGAGPINWASYSVYPQQGSDYSHTGVGVDLSDPRVGYMGCVFNGKVAINIWDGSKLVFSPSSLKILDYAATYEPRHTIQFAPAPAHIGGTFVVWNSGGRIKLCYLSKAGVAGTVRDITPGDSPAACSDRYGTIHIVYNHSGIHYLKIPVMSVAPLAPAGRLATRSPLFRWAGAPGATSYTIQLTQDGVTLPAFAVTPGASNTWQLSSNYPVGSYSWRLKQGGVDSTKPWSPRLAFVIPPEAPAPLSPDGRSDSFPSIPSFTWQDNDPAVNRFVLQLFEGADLLGEMDVYSDGTKTDFSEDWTNNLQAGSYTWRIKAFRDRPDFPVASAWSEPRAFQLGVPEIPVVTTPADKTAFGPATTNIPVAWMAANGADSYVMKVLMNGKAFATHGGILITDGALADTFSPGYYSVMVRGVSAGAGPGPWSDLVTFIITRNMTPEGAVLNQTPALFKWTRSEPATRYLLTLSQYDAGSGKYIVKREAWVAQPASGQPRWTPPYVIPNGRFRWAITDYNGDTRGYTQSALFQIKNSGHDSWNDPALVAGTWRVLTDWRWREMTFQKDGVLRTVQGDGSAFTRARWSATGEILTMVSDVTERCPYTVTATSLTFTLPSGNVKVLVRK